MPQYIQKIKDHVFYKTHLLDRYSDYGVSPTVGRFDASPDMANSWFRLTEGGFLKIDVELLKHELAEAWYTRVDGPGYRSAHDKASVKYPLAQVLGGMMQFIADDPLYKIIRITGPTHNLLGLQVSLEPTIGDPEVEALDHPSSSSGGLNGREVAEQVMLGVERASIDLKKTYYVGKIQYISTDSPPVAVYRQLAIEIIRRIEASRSQRRSE